MNIGKNVVHKIVQKTGYIFSEVGVERWEDTLVLHEVFTPVFAELTEEIWDKVYIIGNEYRR